MKKFKIGVYVLTAIFIFISGCGTVKDKINEKVSEEVLENAVGGKVDITKDGVKVQTEGASFQSGNDLKWPKDAMGNLPEPKAKITAVLNNSDEGCTIAFSEMNLDDAKAYAEKLKELGYKDGLSIFDADGLSYTGTNGGGASVMFLYNSTAGEGSIGYTPAKAD